MKAKAHSDRICETERRHIDGDTQQSSRDCERNLEHCGERIGRRQDRHLVNRENGCDDCVTAAQPTTDEFGGTDICRRTLARNAMRGITLGGSLRIAELEQQLETMRTARQEVETMNCSF